jgi:SET domain-containing protein
MNESNLVTPQEIRAYFSRLGLRYLDRNRIESERFKTYSWANSPYAQANRTEFDELTRLYGVDLKNNKKASLFLNFISPQVGWGVFAQEDMPLGTLVGEYTGIIREAQDCEPVRNDQGHFLSDYAWNYPDELPDGTEFEIDARKEGNELRFVNHSFDPNVGVDHTLVDGIFVTFFKTLTNISAGTQLLIDYGEEYWSGGFRTLELL